MSIKSLPNQRTHGVVSTGCQYGFVGRGKDISAIKSLLDKHSILLLQGPGGAGKTSLLHHMAQQWLDAGTFRQVFYFNYEQNHFGPREIVDTMAPSLMREEKCQKDARSQEPGAGSANPLENYPHPEHILLVLDNFESVTGSAPIPGPPLAEEQRPPLIQLIKTLKATGYKIILCSRGDETGLSPELYENTRYELKGLEPEDRRELADRILKDIPVRDQLEYHRLMDLLAGYPLAMETVLPNLATVHSAMELRKMLARVDLSLRGKEICESIYRAVRIAYYRLSTEAREVLLLLAPFSTFFNALFLEEYGKFLHDTGQFDLPDLTRMEEALAQAQEESLLQEAVPMCYYMQPVLSFCLGRKVEINWEAPKKEELEKAFTRYMERLADEYYGFMHNQERSWRELGVRLFKMDRENLYEALHRVLDEKGNFYLLYNVFGYYYHLRTLPGEAVVFMEEVVCKLEDYPQEDPVFLEDFAHVSANLAGQYLEIRKSGKARECFERALALFLSAGKQREAAAVYHQLGVIDETDRQFEKAKENFRRALDIYGQYDDQHRADTYGHLGNVAEQEKDYETARLDYREALKLEKKFNHHYNQAATYHHLGVLAEKQQDFDTARDYYGKALHTCRDLDDGICQARSYHNLGVVAREEGDLQEAARNFGWAAALFKTGDDPYSQAISCFYLGSTLEESGQLEAAGQHYLNALEIFREYNDTPNRGRTNLHLGILTRKQGDYSAALGFFASAMQLFMQKIDTEHIQTTRRELVELAEVFPPQQAKKAILGLSVVPSVQEMLKEIFHTGTQLS